MGRSTKLRDLIGAIKDKASLSKAALLSKPNTLSLHLSLLRATTHEPSIPPHDKHIAALLSFGNSSRATASAVIEALMDRLQNTHDASVAIKCLIAVHHIIRRGSFILQDQLSIYPSTGGRNYLKLSGFRDSSDPITWELSTWVRWYSCYLEHVLSTSRVLGFFLCSSLSTVNKDEEVEQVSALTNQQLIREIASLVDVIEETYKAPDSLHVHGDRLLSEVMNLAGDDYLSAINEVSLRINEFGERLRALSFGESVELMCALKRLENCKERSSIQPHRKKASMETFWGLVSEMKDRVGKECREDARMVMIGRRDRACESARLGERVLKSSDSVRFGSGRLVSNGFAFSILESVES